MRKISQNASHESREGRDKPLTKMLDLYVLFLIDSSRECLYNFCSGV